MKHDSTTTDVVEGGLGISLSESLTVRLVIWIVRFRRRERYNKEDTHLQVRAGKSHEDPVDTNEQIFVNSADIREQCRIFSKTIRIDIKT